MQYDIHWLHHGKFWFIENQELNVEGKLLEYPPMCEDTLLVVTAGGGRAEPDLCR